MKKMFGVRRLMASTAVAVVMSVAGGAAAFAASSGHLPWRSPDSVISGQPVAVSSVRPCPAPPNAGDRVLVQITLLFAGGGGSAQLLTANSDGSWSGSVIFNFSGAPASGTLNAECQDLTSNTGVTYASYKPHSVNVQGP